MLWSMKGLFCVTPFTKNRSTWQGRNALDKFNDYQPLRLSLAILRRISAIEPTIPALSASRLTICTFAAMRDPANSGLATLVNCVDSFRASESASSS